MLGPLNTLWLLVCLRGFQNFHEEQLGTHKLSAVRATNCYGVKCDLVLPLFGMAASGPAVLGGLTLHGGLSERGSRRCGSGKQRWAELCWGPGELAGPSTTRALGSRLQLTLLGKCTRAGIPSTDRVLRDPARKTLDSGLFS